MDSEFRAYLERYLDEKFKHLEEKIVEGLRMANSDRERLRADITDLYNKDRDMRERVGRAEGDIKTLHEDKADRSTNLRNIALIIGLVLSAIAAAIGWLR